MKFFEMHHLSSDVYRCIEYYCYIIVLKSLLLNENRSSHHEYYCRDVWKSESEKSIPIHAAIFATVRSQKPPIVTFAKIKTRRKKV